ncbi:hypothetical protein BC831DRAFT_469285, partial [Entophlyctis helioformis]
MDEPIQHCVQCGQPFRSSANPQGACSFHSLASGSCCGVSSASAQPFCEHKTHRSTHHHDYPYAAFFERASAVLGYTNTMSIWISTNDTDLEDESFSQSATVGRLLRWSTDAAEIDEPLLVISLGPLVPRPGHNYLFEVFTPQQIATDGAEGQTLIYQTSDGPDSFARAEWILAGSRVSGIRISVKAATSDNPHVQAIRFDAATLSPTASVQTLSRGFQSFKPTIPYELPATRQVGAPLTSQPSRSVRTDFKSVSSGCPVKLMMTSSPPLVANPDFASSDRDNFKGTIAIYNRSTEPVTIASVTAASRLLGSETYEDVAKLDLVDTRLPLTIEPRTAGSITFLAYVCRTASDTALDLRWWGRAAVARKHMDEQEASLVTEYVFTQPTLDAPREDDLGFAFLDDPERFQRFVVRMARPWSSSGSVLQLHGRDYTESDLNRWLDLEINHVWDGGVCEWNAWALVDLACNRVYAFKVLIQQGSLVATKTRATLAYFACPDYGDGGVGDAVETRPPVLAVEKVGFPDLEPEPRAEVIWEDPHDDGDAVGLDSAGSNLGSSHPPGADGIRSSRTSLAPGPAGRMSTAHAAPFAGQGVPTSASLEARLASLDKSVMRTADALERLVAVLEKLPLAQPQHL